MDVSLRPSSHSANTFPRKSDQWSGSGGDDPRAHGPADNAYGPDGGIAANTPDVAGLAPAQLQDHLGSPDTSDEVRQK